ncbi:MAG: HNH endonuclease [Ruminococcus sp.]|nr:HNH endonuclease [Ruminococcus sp.]
MRPKSKRKYDRITRFRSSAAWKKVREQAAERDLHLCRVCLREGRYDTDIQVHHIISLAADFDKRCDIDNLISLCSYHHEKAEAGDIPADVLRELAAKAPPVWGGDFPET